MTTILHTTRGLSLLMGLHRDRIVNLAAVPTALAAAAWLLSLYLA